MMFKEFKWKPFVTDPKYNIDLEVTIIPCKVERGCNNKVTQIFRSHAVNLSNCKTLNIEDDLDGSYCLILDENGYGLAFETTPVFLKSFRFNPYCDQKSASDIVQEIGERLLDYVIDVVNNNSFST